MKVALSHQLHCVFIKDKQYEQKNHKRESASSKYKHEAKMTVRLFTMTQTACTKRKCLFGKINYQSQRKQKSNKK